MEGQSDKAIAEIPATISGYIKEHFAEEGNDFPTGAVIAKIDPIRGGGCCRRKSETPAETQYKIRASVEEGVYSRYSSTCSYGSIWWRGTSEDDASVEPLHVV